MKYILSYIRKNGSWEFPSTSYRLGTTLSFGQIHTSEDEGRRHRLKSIRTL